MKNITIKSKMMIIPFMLLMAILVHTTRVMGQNKTPVNNIPYTIDYIFSNVSRSTGDSIFVTTLAIREDAIKSFRSLEVHQRSKASPKVISLSNTSKAYRKNGMIYFEVAEGKAGQGKNSISSITLYDETGEKSILHEEKNTDREEFISRMNEIDSTRVDRLKLKRAPGREAKSKKTDQH